MSKKIEKKCKNIKFLQNLRKNFKELLKIGPKMKKKNGKQTLKK